MWLQQFLNKREALTSKFWINSGGHVVISINVCYNLKVKPGDIEGYMENLAICMTI